MAISLAMQRKGLAEIECRYLKGVGPKMAEKLAKLGIHTAQDVLFHLPLRYEDRSRVVPIAQLRPGQSAMVEGRILDSAVIKRRQLNLLCRITDGAADLTLRFFHFSNAQRQYLQVGHAIRCYGEVRQGQHGLEIIHPEYSVLKEGEFPPLEKTLTPIYPTTEGVGQHLWRQLTEQVLALLKREDQLQELLPKSVLAELDFPELKQAIHFIHRPPVTLNVDKLADSRHPFQQRLAFEELLAHHLSLQELREKQRQQTAKPLKKPKKLAAKLLKVLPFSLTVAQQRVVEEISQDLQRAHPMMRLVQGDVGSGKTIVAALAAIQAVEAGFQVAVMAPTELLAEQHFKSFSAWLEPLGLQLAWLTAQVKGKARSQVLAEIKSGEAQLVIGTHALFQKQVVFNNLALIIIDEQHRFGVHQRLALKEKGKQAGFMPHQLIMTATPIPRTLAMSVYADLDQSIIDELPPGRKPVHTVVIDTGRREEIIHRIAEVCAQGRQVYWVCTLIEESEVLQCQAAEKSYQDLVAVLGGLKVALVHGRMKSAEKEAVMAAFKAGEVDVLVATTVIEVGVDVPNASLMVIENAERLGLAQLHQLRGRVGRGDLASHCVLLYQKPLSRLGGERLSILRQTNDGFLIAQRDLELRGPGEVLGTKQTGEVDFRVADLLRDKALLSKVQQVAKQVLQYHPDLVLPLTQRWLGSVKQYARV